jgi:endonuclease YncB( thermonuclease family)
MYEYEIREVTKVVDGDTIDVVFDVGFSMFRKERIRLNGIDTPESVTSDVTEKKLGLESKQFLQMWLSRQTKIRAKTTKDDKYGRILAEVYGDDGVCVNRLMVEKGYAWDYDGGTKHKDFAILLERRKA